MDTFSAIETGFFRRGIKFLCGVDEVGRGPLAGPVVAAAVILPPDDVIEGINDSKQLRPSERERLAGEITLKALAWSAAEASPREIEDCNILAASRLAMKRAVESLSLQPEYCLLDGFPILDWDFPHEGIIRGDSLCFTIAAASILAKVHRDKLMVELHRQFPQYGFDRHKGYPTADHRTALWKYGPCSEHRSTFNLYGDTDLK